MEKNSVNSWGDSSNKEWVWAVTVDIEAQSKHSFLLSFCWVVWHGMKNEEGSETLRNGDIIIINGCIRCGHGVSPFTNSFFLNLRVFCVSNRATTSISNSNTSSSKNDQTPKFQTPLRNKSGHTRNSTGFQFALHSCKVTIHLPATSFFFTSQCCTNCNN